MSYNHGKPVTQSLASFKTFSFNGKRTTRGRIASTLTKILKRTTPRAIEVQESEPVFIAPIQSPVFMGASTTIVEDDGPYVAPPAPVQGCQTPAQRRQQITRYLRNFTPKARRQELFNMQKHGDNWFFPVFDTDKKFLSFLIARACHERDLRRKRQAKRRFEKLSAEALAIAIDHHIQEVTGMWTCDYESFFPFPEVDMTPMKPQVRRSTSQPLTPWVCENRLPTPPTPRDPVLANLLRHKVRSFRECPVAAEQPDAWFKDYAKAVFAQRLPQAKHQGLDLSLIHI